VTAGTLDLVHRGLGVGATTDVRAGSGHYG
jgi:hypothetical protein